MPGLRPTEENRETFDAVTSRGVKAMPSKDRSILKPISLVEVSVQERSIRVEEMTFAWRLAGIDGSNVATPMGRARLKLCSPFRFGGSTRALPSGRLINGSDWPRGIQRLVRSCCQLVRAPLLLSQARNRSFAGVPSGTPGTLTGKSGASTNPAPSAIRKKVADPSASRSAVAALVGPPKSCAV